MSKGQRQFTQKEAAQVRALLREKISADRTEQKRIRHRLRKLGFYISDFAKVESGFAVSDFEDLISSGEIRISD